MSPTIRIDDEVYEWLKSKAVPFDDTPNSVLRRIANLDNPEDAMKSVPMPEPSKRVASRSGFSRSPLATGDELARRVGLNVNESRFHRDGTFYNPLSAFPAALFDCDGYVILPTEQSYLDHPKMKVGKKLNVVGGVSSLPDYVRVPDLISSSP